MQKISPQDWALFCIKFMVMLFKVIYLTGKLHFWKLLDSLTAASLFLGHQSQTKCSFTYSYTSAVYDLVHILWSSSCVMKLNHSKLNADVTTYIDIIQASCILATATISSYQYQPETSHVFKPIKSKITGCYCHTLSVPIVQQLCTHRFDSTGPYFEFNVT